ncbi:family 20 glycosylhydrolase [Niabella ginsengisoli]|uniref:beta-N-acetylhexosaminidase n=1 Tax=Niabella ginsengisoli TaxID=522298 RepID=A0ABS9SIQ4_9BACT|nr:family 20 glycosylhydrolase [Niabella ginsengisoli]MCH5598226.1 family 20 glycosylhydrolase [Niabella ginsengisoli]
MGWNDILADSENLPASTAIMSWLGRGAVLKAAQNKFYTIATPTGPLYFDIQQHSRDDGTMADLNYQGPNTIEAVYDYDPGKGLSQSESKYLLGVQANMWPAVPQEVKDINVQNFPRLLAVAEIGWTNVENKELSGFLKRLDSHLPRLSTLKIDYFKLGGYIAGVWQPEQISTNFKTLSWDVTEKVYADGRVTAAFSLRKELRF